MNSCAGAGPHGGSLSDLHMQIVIFVSPFVSVCLVSGVPSSCNPRMNPVARSLPARNHPLNSHTNFVFTKATKLVSQFRVAVLQSSIHFWYDSWQEALCVCVLFQLFWQLVVSWQLLQHSFLPVWDPCCHQDTWQRPQNIVTSGETSRIHGIRRGTPRPLYGFRHFNWHSWPATIKTQQHLQKAPQICMNTKYISYIYYSTAYTAYIYIYIHRYVHHHVYLCIFIYHVILGQIIADQFLTIWPDSQPGKTAPQPEVSYLQPSKDDGGTCAVQTNSFIIHQTGRKYGEDRNFVKFVEMYQVQIWRCFQFSVFLVSRVVLIRVPSDMLQTLGDRCSTRRAQTFGVPTHGTNGLQPLGPQPSHPA